jgi:hypothetical protein
MAPVSASIWHTPAPSLTPSTAVRSPECGPSLIVFLASTWLLNVQASQARSSCLVTYGTTKQPMTPPHRKYSNYSKTTSGSSPVVKRPQWCKQTRLLEEAPRPVDFWLAFFVVRHNVGSRPLRWCFDLGPVADSDVTASLRTVHAHSLLHSRNWLAHRVRYGYSGP